MSRERLYRSLPCAHTTLRTGPGGRDPGLMIGLCAQHCWIAIATRLDAISDRTRAEPRGHSTSSELRLKSLLDKFHPTCQILCAHDEIFIQAQIDYEFHALISASKHPYCAIADFLFAKIFAAGIQSLENVVAQSLIAFFSNYFYPYEVPL